MGFASEIYVEHIAREYQSELFHFRQYKSSPDQVLLVHHSMGHDQAERIAELDEIKI